ncbi:uncharacterized protein LOC130102397 isoform X1 [Rhinichthys klamathensis goyatoka]|uniref:uncharacterized protein LOC130102397 isoform X1 n=1 Tax=Rhinichthys klamathensis goyatoka TaxID=3034132 RepID=UPI0024B48517|nr:uncharacterized protein LOC130102397 isoform X1 [Rhinichthys klamathensis goyatoka]
MYAVVTLQDSDEVMVVASHWLSLDKKQSYWPPFRSTEKCMEAVQNRLKPETGGKPWEKLNISFHKEYVIFDNAKEGQKEMKQQKERSKRGFGILKRQRLENTVGMLKNQLQTLPPVPPASRTDDKEELLQMLREIKSMVQENSAMLKKLLKDNTDSEVPSSSTSVPNKEVKTNLNLPLKTFEDVNNIERELNTAASRKKMVKYLSMLGGFGPKDVIKNIMQRILTDDLAKEFNWQGRGDKKPFSKLILADVIRDAAVRPNLIRVDCENEIKKYLSYTADRLRRRPREQGGIGPEIPNVISPTPMDDDDELEEIWKLFTD